MIEEMKKILKLNTNGEETEKNLVSKIKYENSNMIISLLKNINFNQLKHYRK